ncbi:hypothetical protein KVT40_009223 [Elsinoe batatas]|uniref:Uncharacterized protein n=1 Tax=Elsinoe batatas TaxID=2601811 RepID=A0A8K0PB13_9PEZI|nr:hypothetical protein KVT40_009223 [Elsinoe batatas]
MTSTSNQTRAPALSPPPMPSSSRPFPSRRPHLPSPPRPPAFPSFPRYPVLEGPSRKPQAHKYREGHRPRRGQMLQRHCAAQGVQAFGEATDGVMTTTAATTGLTMSKAPKRQTFTTQVGRLREIRARITVTKSGTRKTIKKASGKSVERMTLGMMDMETSIETLRAEGTSMVDVSMC